MRRRRITTAAGRQSLLDAFTLEVSWLYDLLSKRMSPRRAAAVTRLLMQLVFIVVSVGTLPHTVWRVVWPTKTAEEKQE